MRNCILSLIAILVLPVLLAVAVAADNQTVITIVGGKATVEDSAVINISNDISIEGYVVGEDGVFTANKGTEVHLFPMPYRVIIHRLKKSKGLLGQPCLLGGNDSITEILGDTDRFTLRAGEFAEVIWRTPPPEEPATAEPRPQPPEQPIMITPTTWEPPYPLNSGDIIIIVAGQGGYFTEEDFPAFPGNEVTITTPMNTILRGFAASWMFVNVERGRDTQNTPDDAGPTMSYPWGQWSPWEDQSGYRPEIAVWLAPFWQQQVPATNTLTFRSSFGPQFRLRSAKKIGDNGETSFGAYWASTGWRWFQIE